MDIQMTSPGDHDAFVAGLRWLADGDTADTVSGTSKHASLTIDNEAPTSGSNVINGRTYAAGKAVQFDLACVAGIKNAITSILLDVQTTNGERRVEKLSVGIVEGD